MNVYWVNNNLGFLFFLALWKVWFLFTGAKNILMQSRTDKKDDIQVVFLLKTVEFLSDGTNRYLKICSSLKFSSIMTTFQIFIAFLSFFFALIFLDCKKSKKFVLKISIAIVHFFLKSHFIFQIV